MYITSQARSQDFLCVCVGGGGGGGAYLKNRGPIF